MNYWSSTFAIGSLQVPRFIGGPLDGITDAPFRQLVREYDTKSLLYTEMRHVGSVAADKTGERTLRFLPLERPINYQVAANAVRDIEIAAEKIQQSGVDAIDLNCGCPAKNVVSSGSGSALMADLPRLKEIVTALRQHVRVPLTIKMRAGFKQQNAVEVAQMLEQCGVDALSIHPRLQSQHFSGRPDYALAGAVKKAVSIPVIISGGVVNAATARMVYEQAGVDGYLIGRGIWSKPWKLAELQAHVEGREYIITPAQVLAAAIRHFDLMLDYYGSHGLYCFRKHLPFYLKGLPGAATLRADLVSSTDEAYIRTTLLRLKDSVDGKTL